MDLARAVDRELTLYLAGLSLGLFVSTAYANQLCSRYNAPVIPLRVGTLPYMETFYVSK